MSKSTLNTLSTIAGLVAASSSLLGNTGLINHGLATVISSVATSFLGYLVQRPSEIVLPREMPRHWGSFYASS
ncbi:hypothetical protein [Nostoc sp. NMS9]|uniref:hypothetical protein n=1 Tax=Nostoc sp. NMS9 TaxID=2815393 RepID=UPI0025F43DFB|nr:hypothetical protein [Nostoc sp. NMS9]MBN3939185.1 hypothetical protein [Nostoc sp. NMS9]